jgi:DNA-binding transcriptional ArsR family regulator
MVAADPSRAHATALTRRRRLREYECWRSGLCSNIYRILRYTCHVLLNYLIPSRARRELLRLLWAEGHSGSVSELARQADLSFAAAHRELEDMRAAGVAEREREGNRLVYRARAGHDQATLLRNLGRLAAQPEVTPPPDEIHADTVRGWLRDLGAPLGAPPSSKRAPSVETAVADGLALSHQNSTVARVLALVLWRQREKLDLDQLVREATRRDERETLGFYLELTSRLGRYPRFAKASRALRDRRRTRVRLFFAKPHSAYDLTLARKNTPAAARRWGYLMNMGVDSFASAFTKHAGAA